MEYRIDSTMFKRKMNRLRKDVDIEINKAAYELVIAATKKTADYARNFASKFMFDGTLMGGIRSKTDDFSKTVKTGRVFVIPEVEREAVLNEIGPTAFPGEFPRTRYLGAAGTPEKLRRWSMDYHGRGKGRLELGGPRTHWGTMNKFFEPAFTKIFSEMDKIVNDYIDKNIKNKKY